MDGVLCAIGALDGKLKETDPYRGQLEQMIWTYALPELTSPHGLIRAKVIAIQITTNSFQACWLFSRYADLAFTMQDKLAEGIQRVLTLTQDPDLPVRVAAAIALKKWVQTPLGMAEASCLLSYQHTGKEILRPYLSQLFESCLFLFVLR